MFYNFWRKTAAFLMCLAVVATAGCESRRPQNKEEEASSAPVTENDESLYNPKDNIELLDDLDGKYIGRTYVIATTNPSLFQNSKKEEGKGSQQNPLEKAVSDRMDLLSKSFGVKFEIKVEDSEKDIKEAMRKAAEKGSHYADLVCASAELMAELTEMGLLENMHTLPYVDFDADYMPGESLTQQSTGGKLFFYSGDATLSLNSTTVLFYNKGITDSAELKPVSKVLDGDFTWDVLAEMANTAADMGKYGIDCALDREELLYSLYASTGNKFITPTAAQPQISYNTDAVQAVNGINTALFENTELAPERENGADAIADFKAGKTAFLVARLDSVAAISEKPENGGSLVEWGILPMPKLSATQAGYFAPVNDITSCIAVPKNSADSAFAGFMLNAFLAASTNGLDEGLKTTYINYYFWNNDSARMLNLIENSLSYDLGIFYSSLPQVYDVSTRLLASEDNLNIKDEDKQFFYKFSDRVFG